MTEEEGIAERVPRHFASLWLRKYARGKLRHDPLYRASFERLGTSPLPLLDIGCGIGLHAFYLRERGYRSPIIGLDVDAAKIAAGQEVAKRHYQSIDLRTGDGATPPEFAGNVALLDVLHYFPAETQHALLVALACRVAPGGWSIIRTSPRDRTWRFRATQVEEWFTRGIRWMSRPALAFPIIDSVTACFPADEFEHDVRPLWGRTPFNSWLLAFRRR